ncbi:MAG TPA: formate dehydrogenase accessory protein FdhE [Gemmatimonadales bacterium]|nr:formate dehydrogenase accessory protein FdhE [Gemmatimonadales bacterium]
MRRPAAGLQRPRADRLTALEREAPAWAPWFALWRAAEEMRAGAPAVRVSLAPVRGANAPLLDGAAVQVDVGWARTAIDRLCSAARVEWAGSPLTLLSTAMEQRPPDAPGAAAIGQFALVVLLARSADLAGRVPVHWTEGYCPVCGAWPIRAELRGVARARHLRCGRCGADWTAPALRCTYCGESRHDHLGALSVEGELDRRRVETCHSCHRYLKTFAALLPATPLDMLADDLETLPLDVVAGDRGFSRPDTPGYRVTVGFDAC